MTSFTDAQERTIKLKFEQSPDGASSLLEFRARWTDYGPYIGATWCGMFLGIEKDGHAHS